MGCVIVCVNKFYTAVYLEFQGMVGPRVQFV